MTITGDRSTFECRVCRAPMSAKAFHLDRSGGNAFCGNCHRTRGARIHRRAQQRREARPRQPQPSAELVEAGKRYVATHREANHAWANVQNFVGAATVDDDTAKVTSTLLVLLARSKAAKDAALAAFAYFVMIDARDTAERKKAAEAGANLRAAERRKQARINGRETLALMRAPDYRSLGDDAGL